MTSDQPDEPVAIPITGELDLHTFAPRDVASLLDEYCRVCTERGILRLRIIHGKGTGTLRATVHSRLQNMPGVATFAVAEPRDGGWGATIVTLKAKNSSG